MSNDENYNSFEVQVQNNSINFPDTTEIDPINNKVDKKKEEQKRFKIILLFIILVIILLFVLFTFI